ncbi:MAG: endopeptidase La [Deltaproteobacteria bacterium]|nr:endopeptidase La [Deltaproteobacteria bacterium]
MSKESPSKAPDPNHPLPLLPLRDIVIFPHMVVPLFVGRERSIRALDEAMRHDKWLFLCAQKKAKTNDPSAEDICGMGTIGLILQLLKLPDGTVKVLVEGRRRARIRSYLETSDFYQVLVEDVPESKEMSIEMEALMRTVNASFEGYAKLNKKVPPELLVSVGSVADPARLADAIAAHLTLKLKDKQALLEITDVRLRLERLFGLLEAEIEILQVEKRIRTRVKKQMERAQKEYYLNEQMRAIQRELGEKDEFKTEAAELEEKINKKKMSEEATRKVKRELKKFKLMSPMSAEATVVRNYIDWIISLPWSEVSKEKLDLAEAEQILNEDHYGLETVKERILEYLAVKSLTEGQKAPILCFVGPPGVGKTSLAQSIARATGRRFVRASLGGVRDEAEIRGHRRTYIGSLPGKIIQSLRRAGTNNPVFLLDEVDKMSADFRGDPAAALLEVLDPEQNKAFQDHYLDLDYDLSQVMFITTANTVHAIPPALLDRMEVIRLPGYIESEKLEIARRFLVPKQLKAHGLTDGHLRFTDGALTAIIRQYTREAGVRNLEREIATVCRKVARDVVKKGTGQGIRVTPQRVAKHLGVPKYRFGLAEVEDRVGIALGLAWTEMGGELLLTEVSVMPGKGKLTVTGKLGDVMQESAHAALSYVRSRAAVLGLEKHFYQKVDVHIHVPEGAIPKDGPSAGITMATAIISALTRVPVRAGVAMTGEITLRGRVLPIGGLKEKIVAAHRGKVLTVLIPRENEKDLKEIPKHIQKALKIVSVEQMDDVLRHALALEDPEAFLHPRTPVPKPAYLPTPRPVGEPVAVI